MLVFRGVDPFPLGKLGKTCSRQPFDTGGSRDSNSAAGSSDDPNGARFVDCVVEGYQEWTKDNFGDRGE